MDEMSMEFWKYGLSCHVSFLFYPRRGRQRHTAIQCTSTFHHLCYKSHVIGGGPIAIYWIQLPYTEKTKNQK
ncbi:hypothetical protein SFRURICE_008409 [Spodoptera frugiperda]|nr:hypothetical protein SFRURICE_008409 [Spodoptera frugiperda]